jgi:hypothetical protein
MLAGDVYNGLVMRFAWRVLPLRDCTKKPGTGVARFHASGGTDLLQRAGSLFDTDVFLDYSRTTTDEPHRVSGL